MKSTILLLFIIILASLIRLTNLSNYPPGVNRDEASIGYTAYSILKTGKDEYGNLYPLSFRSFGDWKLPLYIYVTIPSVIIFGLSEFSVRLPSALAGIATVYIVAKLLPMLFGNTKESFRMGLLAALSLTISPWHIHLSRMASEANLSVFFTTFGLYLFFLGLKGNEKIVGLSFIVLILPFYTYHGNHIFSSLLLFGLCVLYRNTIPRTRYTVIMGLVAAMLVMAILRATLFSANVTKLSGIGLFGDPTIVHEKIEKPRVAHDNNFYARLIHNRPLFAIETFAKNYINSYGPEFLFFKGGGNHAHNIPLFGNLYLVDSPWLYLGVAVLLLLVKTPHKPLLLWWLIIAPIASSITKDAPHTARMHAFNPLSNMLIAIGLFIAMNTTLRMLPKIVRFLPILILLILYGTNILFYADRYLVHFPIEEARYWGKGYQMLTALIKEKNPDRVIIANPEESPYIYLLFYSQYDPLLYQRQTKLYPATQDGFSHVASFGMFEFRAPTWDADVIMPNTIIVDYHDRINNSFLTSNASIALQKNYPNSLIAVQTSEK